MARNSKLVFANEIKMDRNYVNVLSYPETWMIDLIYNSDHFIAEDSDYSFLRTQNEISTKVPYNLCLKSNYIGFQNPDYDNKWFFAWIDEVIYVNNGTCRIRYTIDSWSTWYDYWDRLECFVKREHTNDDRIGANTVEENLPVQSVQQEELVYDSSLSEYTWICVSTSYNPSTKKQFDGITMYNGQLFGQQLFLFRSDPISNLKNLALFILATNADGRISDINNIFVIPDGLITQANLTQYTGEIADPVSGTTVTYTFYGFNSYTADPASFDMNFSKQYSYYDYEPKNKKCFVYPYNYLLVSNNCGNYNIYKYELFGGSNVDLKIELAIGVGVSGRIVPINYMRQATADDESLPLAKYPTCGWSADAYTNWLTQNAVNAKTKILSTAGKAIGQELSGDIIGGIGTVSNSILGFMSDFYSANLLPNIEGGGENIGNVLFAAKRNTFYCRKMRVRTEYLKIIDDFFTRFGYATNRVKKPNILGRSIFNYVEVGPNESIGYGRTPSKYLDDINKCARKGVTIWHQHENIGKYNIDNPITA